MRARPIPVGQIDAVHEVLGEIDAAAVPELLVFNKADLAPGVAKELVADHPGSVADQHGDGRGHRPLPADLERPPPLAAAWCTNS